MWQNSYDGSPSLYLVPTPIGNLDDMTYRGVQILQSVDVIFCEDTRVTAQLLNHFNIKKTLISLHNFNENDKKNEVLRYLSCGNNVALVTDRGTPIISDPGYKTVKYLRDNGYNVICLPGACAFVPALVMSSICSEHFIFYGFLSCKESKMRSELEYLKYAEYSIVFYEAPHRIKMMLNNMYEIFGDRFISISREISKLHESVYVGMLSDLLKNENEFRGEFVIVVSPYQDIPNEIEQESINDAVLRYLRSGLTRMEAIKMVARERHISKSDVYREYHKEDNK